MPAFWLEFLGLYGESTVYDVSFHIINLVMTITLVFLICCFISGLAWGIKRVFRAWNKITIQI